MPRLSLFPKIPFPRSPARKKKDLALVELLGARGAGHVRPGRVRAPAGLAHTTLDRLQTAGFPSRQPARQSASTLDGSWLRAGPVVDVDMVGVGGFQGGANACRLRVGGGRVLGCGRTCQASARVGDAQGGCAHNRCAPALPPPSLPTPTQHQSSIPPGSARPEYRGPDNAVEPANAPGAARRTRSTTPSHAMVTERPHSGSSGRSVAST